MSRATDPSRNRHHAARTRTVGTRPAPVPGTATVAPTSESLSERAYRLLRDKLIYLEIEPGAPLAESALGDELAVGRTPIREALKRLEIDRLVVTYPRRGTFATAIEVTDLEHIARVREALEPLAARLAASDRDQEDIDHLRELRRTLDTLADDTPHTALLSVDLEVHRGLYQATHNPYLIDELLRFDQLATRIWSLVIDDVPDLAARVREHAGVLDAVILGDVDQAVRLTTEHVLGFAGEVRQLLLHLSRDPTSERLQRQPSES